MIKDICAVLEVIATILAVALFIPGLDIIVALAIAVTALALAGRTLLAATGNGSSDGAGCLSTTGRILFNLRIPVAGLHRTSPAAVGQVG
jgi:hypothetical protein